MTSTIPPSYSKLPLSQHRTLSTTDTAKRSCVCNTEENVKRRNVQCDDHGHHCFMCDDHANGGRKGGAKYVII